MLVYALGLGLGLGALYQADVFGARHVVSQNDPFGAPGGYQTSGMTHAEQASRPSSSHFVYAVRTSTPISIWTPAPARASAWA